MTKLQNKISKFETKLANAQTKQEKDDLQKTLTKLRNREFKANHSRRAKN